jgi:TPP-dependent indolepyruvate ferredoxin oxidoreductase alpha subunit
MLLLNTASELVLRRQVKETMVPTPAPAATRATVNHRKVPHFWFKMEAQELISLDCQGAEKVLVATTGIILREVLKALSELEREKSQQRFFDIWCEATLPSGQIIRCWPQY